ncbi:MAG: glycosyltransferase family 2 protein [Sphingobacteriaceae bacterium]|nr:glycosyltransferase family 2 protein [Sphingobacteriaceae bacterium]
MKVKLLSICIPTYNRAEVLDSTLNSLFSNPDFDAEKIEVVVVDNCSTDDTKEIVSGYPLVNYYRNSHHVKDVDFTIVLGYATGDYIRLLNDTISFKPGKLKEMLERIEKQKDIGVNLFFCQNIFLHKNCRVDVDNKESYLKEISFYSTWIANFGVWREDYLKIDDKHRYDALLFSQVDWCYRIVSNNKKTIIYFEDLFDVTTPNKKGGYNIFKTFVEDYLYIIKQERISFFAYEVEKYRLLRYFVYGWLGTLLVTHKDNYSFDTKGAFKIVLKKYWYEPYFYIAIIFFWCKRIKSKGII